MTKRVLLIIGLIGLYVISMTALAAAKDMTWAGWIQRFQVRRQGRQCRSCGLRQEVHRRRRKAGAGHGQGHEGGRHR